MSGIVAGLYIAPVAGASMRSMTEVRAVPGRGLEGDRYFTGPGTFTGDRKRGSELTLIALEDLTAVQQETGVTIAPGDARRNIVTQQVSFKELVGREFSVGEVALRGTRLSEPCLHLARLTHEKFLKSLVHRSGLQAEILTQGLIRLGDPILVS